MISVSIIKKEFIDLMWVDIEPLLELAVEKSNGELSIDRMKEKLNKHEMLLATIKEDGNLIAAITFEQRDFPTGKRILHVATAGGESASKWIDQVNVLCEKLAKEHDCSEIYIIGRPGWAKTLKHLDYKVVHTVISRKVGA